MVCVYFVDNISTNIGIIFYKNNSMTLFLVIITAFIYNALCF